MQRDSQLKDSDLDFNTFIGAGSATDAEYTTGFLQRQDIYRRIRRQLLPTGRLTGQLAFDIITALDLAYSLAHLFKRLICTLSSLQYSRAAILILLFCCLLNFFKRSVE